MSEKTGIAWTNSTWNLAWGCTKISPGCKFCYADDLADRYGFDVWGPDKSRRTFKLKHWQEPLKWNAAAHKAGNRHKVFCSSMCDIFEDHPTIIGELAKLWTLIKSTPFLDWQLLTKRHDRIEQSLPADWGEGWPNVWLGVSIENNDYVERADYLHCIPAAVRFVSYEPALGPLNLLELSGIDWVIYGGESGKDRRPEDKQWARDMRDRCATHEPRVAFFHKQSSAIRTEMGIELDGVIIREFPTPRKTIPAFNSQGALFNA